MPFTLQVDERPSRSNPWLQRTAVGLSVLLFIGLLTRGALDLTRTPDAPVRQRIRITVLPDQPPAPAVAAPTTPRHDFTTTRSTPQAEARPAAPPSQREAAPVKMEGTPAAGPGQFAAGPVQSDYIGTPGGADTRFAAYSRNVERFIEAALQRHALHAVNARIYLWLSADGTIQRTSIDQANSGDQAALRAAVERLERVADAPPPGMPMPLGLEISIQ